MASRASQSPAVILHTKDAPSGDRIVTLLTPDEGIVDAFMFGGPKSKLRSLASPYHAGTAWMYRDPVKDYRKLTDFDVSRPFQGIREDLRRLGAAAFFAEAALRTHSFGGEYAVAFDLVTDALAAIEAVDACGVDYAMIQFAFRMATALGMGLDFQHGAVCSGAGTDCCGGDEKGHGFLTEHGTTYFAPAESAFWCSDCACDGNHAGMFELSSGAVRYLERTVTLQVLDALRVSVEERSRLELKAAAFALARHVCDGPLRSLADGSGSW